MTSWGVGERAEPGVFASRRRRGLDLNTHDPPVSGLADHVGLPTTLLLAQMKGVQVEPVRAEQQAQLGQHKRLRDPPEQAMFHTHTRGPLPQDLTGVPHVRLSIVAESRR
jgi:hypothetical protein